MKQLIGKDVGAYTFDAVAKTVTITGLDRLVLEDVLLITNVTDNLIIYQFNEATKGGSIAANVITLTYDTTSMSNTDRLQIWVDYNQGDLWQSLSLGGYGYHTVADQAALGLANAEVDFVLIRHPAATNILTRYWEQLVGANVSANNSVLVRVYIGPTITTAGTSMTIRKVRPSVGASSVMTAGVLPVIAARGSLIVSYIQPNGTFNRQLFLSRYQEQGTDLLFTITPSANGSFATFTSSWAEVPI